jgi:hypothetical protein
MRRRTAGVDGKSFRNLELKITPSMRRKVENLARWLAGGDASQVRAAREAIVEVLRNAARR